LRRCDASGYLTGNTLFADGGSHINGVAWAPDLDAVPTAVDLPAHQS
jgi:hypothetical protein